MKVVKQINNNAALALDEHGAEVVILGNGVGFPVVPYELNDLSRIRRTFYDVDPKYMEMIAAIPQSILMVAADICEKAEMELDCQLNPNLSFTLADHINFATSQMKDGIQMSNPLAYDVKQLYPKEYRLSVSALGIMKDSTGILLPESEITNIALHIIGGEIENKDNRTGLVTIQIMQDIDVIIEDMMKVQLNKESYQYGRFMMHLRYLVQRLSSGEERTNTNEILLKSLVTIFPKTYDCAKEIGEYFSSKWQWTCSKDEIFYLMLHINRMISKD